MLTLHHLRILDETHLKQRFADLAKLVVDRDGPAGSSHGADPDRFPLSATWPIDYRVSISAQRRFHSATTTWKSARVGRAQESNRTSVLLKECNEVPHPADRFLGVVPEPGDGIAWPRWVGERRDWQMVVEPVVRFFEPTVFLRRKTTFVAKQSCLGDDPR